MMKIVTLLENKSNVKGLKSKHGLSLYIEWNDKKILFDLGPNKYYRQNAEKLGIDLTEVDYVIISHGHYDHGLKLNQFLDYNKKAKVVISKHAFDSHITKVGAVKLNIGLEQLIQKNRAIFVEDECSIEGMIITPNVEYKQEILSDERLFVKQNGEYVRDDFNHEIYLILQEKGQKILFTGCSHKGIQNIVETLEEKYKTTFNYVIGGYHLMRYNTKDLLQTDYIETLGRTLNQKPTTFYACHCTGEDAFELLSKTMNNILPLHTGEVISI